MGEKTYPLAPTGIFRTIQGEGALLGLPMVFIRLGGCSVGCPGCDTNYTISERLSVEQVRERVARLVYGATEWAWITGGEPADYDLTPLIEVVRSCHLKVALATAGIKPVPRGFLYAGVDFLSVSPHSTNWVQTSGEQLNLVPGLNGLRLGDIQPLVEQHARNFTHRYITPLADQQGRVVNLKECVNWVESHPGWKLGVQAHKHWGLA